MSFLLLLGNWPTPTPYKARGLSAPGELLLLAYGPDEDALGFLWVVKLDIDDETLGLKSSLVSCMLRFVLYRPLSIPRL